MIEEEKREEVKIFEKVDLEQWEKYTISRDELLENQPYGSNPTFIFVSRKQFKDKSRRTQLSSIYNIPPCFWADACQRLQGYFGCEDRYNDANEVVVGHATWFHFEVKYLYKEETSKSKEVSKSGEISKSEEVIKSEEVNKSRKANKSKKADKSEEAKKIKLPEYKWLKMAFFVSWMRPNQTVVICFDVPEMLQGHLFDTLRTDAPIRADWNDPYSVHLVIVEAVVDCYNTAVWNLRDAIRQFEEDRRKARDESPEKIDEPDFTVLHELARHTLHKMETLGVAVETLSSMTDQQQAFHQDVLGSYGPGRRRDRPRERALGGQYSPASNGQSLDDSSSGALPATTAAACDRGKIVEVKRTQQHLLFQLRMLKSLEARAKANDGRIRNEITLAFNIVAQRDSRANAAINVSTRSDSVTMKAIAVLTMFFLPSMFVSAIFSMSFFDFSEGNGRMSGEFWIYAVITAPLTFFTLAVFYVYERWQQRSNLQHLRWLLPSVIYDRDAHGRGRGQNDSPV